MTIIILLFCSCQPDPYTESVRKHRREINAKFLDPKVSPLPKKERTLFEGLNFYKIKKAFKTEAEITLYPGQQIVMMGTSDYGEKAYVRYGKLKFQLKGKTLELTAFRKAKQQQGKYGNRLFIPFSDLTNGEETYGGGRYLDIPVPENTALSIDFNKAYNPWCAYNAKYSCPLPPAENFLDLKIQAGEKKF